MSKRPACDVLHVTSEDEWPTGLKTADEIAEVVGVTPERIRELAAAHMIPHWRVDNGSPLFKLTEVKKWAAKNLMTRIEGGELPLALRIMIDPPAAKDAPPALREIRNLRAIPIHEYPPGVYFLVGKHGRKPDVVLYVGQSINPLARVGQHRKDRAFERAYYIPVPSWMLDGVEGALIRALNPPLNSGARATACGPGDPREDARMLEEYAPGVRLPVVNEVSE